jgi:hypothetical protein
VVYRVIYFSSSITQHFSSYFFPPGFYFFHRRSAFNNINTLKTAVVNEETSALFWPAISKAVPPSGDVRTKACGKIYASPNAVF